MRIPRNKIIENQYTIGGEFVYSQNSNEYKGYYCIIGGTQYFAGKVYDPKAYRLDKLVDSPTNNPALKPLAGSLISPLTTDKLLSKQYKITSEDITNGYVTRYFVKKSTSNPIEIKEVGQDTFITFKTNPLYQCIELILNLSSNNDTIMNEAYKEMIGLKEFLSV